MSDPMTSEFMKSFGGGAAANLIFVGIFMIYKIFSQKCRHSKCRSHTACFEFTAQEDSLSSTSKDEDEPKDPIHTEIRNIRKTFDEKIQHFIVGIQAGLHKSRKTIVQTLQTQRGNLTDIRKLVEEQDVESKV